MTFETLKKSLSEHNQGQILRFYEDLGTDEQEKLLAQVTELDLCQIDGWIEKYIINDVGHELPKDFSPADYYPVKPVDAAQRKKYADAIELGQKLISEGKVAAFVVAGGQGSRLGFDGPKGNYPVTAIKRKTLFNVFAESIAATQARYNSKCPWYIMASELNYGQTVEIFEENSYFGLNKDDVVIFKQGTLPNFDFEGKILLRDKSTIASSPDGHGGSLKALYKSGSIDDMQARGVEYMTYWQVDNPLINIFDPLFIGLHALDKADMSSKALKKTGPLEKVGNFCLVDNKVTVIEYSDLPDELAYRKNDEGSLVFELGSIGIHMISRKFVEKINAKEFGLPLHKAIKKIPCIDIAGNSVEPVEPNGIKLESFIFDAIPMADHSIIFETIREEEFGPVKNATGVDSAESSRQMQIDRAAKWLEYAGVKVPRAADGKADCVIEISTLFAMDKEQLKAKANQIPEIKAGDSVYLG